MVMENIFGRMEVFIKVILSKEYAMVMVFGKILIRCIRGITDWIKRKDWERIFGRKGRYIKDSFEMILCRVMDNFMFLLKRDRNPHIKDVGLKEKKIRMEKLIKMLSNNYIHFWNKLNNSTIRLKVILRRKKKEWVIKIVFLKMNIIIINIIDKCTSLIKATYLFTIHKISS